MIKGSSSITAVHLILKFSYFSKVRIDSITGPKEENGFWLLLSLRLVNEKKCTMWIMRRNVLQKLLLAEKSHSFWGTWRFQALLLRMPLKIHQTLQQSRVFEGKRSLPCCNRLALKEVRKVKSEIWEKGGISEYLQGVKKEEQNKVRQSEEIPVGIRKKNKTAYRIVLKSSTAKSLANQTKIIIEEKIRIG